MEEESDQDSEIADSETDKDQGMDQETEEKSFPHQSQREMNIKEGDIARWNQTYASANGDDSPGPIKNKASTVRGGQS